METFYIYEHRSVAPHRAIIHRGSCRSCKEGRAKGRNSRLVAEGRWLGPFASLALAEFASATLFGVTVRGTHQCVDRQRGF